MAEFKMNVTGTAFDILSSKLYKQPYHAIVRELVLNGIDAHRVAGYDGAVQVGYGTSDDIDCLDKGYWFCRDFGNGLTQFDVERIYTSFFSSTKKTDGEQIGCFGLGSKTPFAVTNEYFVISIVDTGDKSNEKTVYRMFKNGGAPQWEIVSQSKTLEHTGLEIRIAYENINAFNMNTAINDVVKNIVEDVELCNVSSYVEDNIESSKRNTVIDKNIRYDHSEGIMINLNGYMYYIASYDIRNNLSKESHRYVKSLGMVNIQMIVNATKSDITLTPSRESVHFDSKTIEFLNDAIANTFKVITKNLFEECFYNAIYIMQDCTRELFVDFFNDLDIIEKSLIVFEHRFTGSIHGIMARKLNMQPFASLLSKKEPFKFIKLDGSVAERHVKEVLPKRLKKSSSVYHGLLNDSLIAEFSKNDYSNFSLIFATTDDSVIDIIKKYNKNGIEYVPMIKNKSEKKVSSLDEAFWKNLITMTDNTYLGNDGVNNVRQNESQYTKYVLPSTYFGSDGDLTRLASYIIKENSEFTRPIAELANKFIGKAIIHVETNPKRYEKFLKEGYVSYGDKLKEFFTRKDVCDIFVKAKTIDDNIKYVSNVVFKFVGGSFSSKTTISLGKDEIFKEFNISKLCRKVIAVKTGIRSDIFGIWGQLNTELYNHDNIDERIRKIVNSNNFDNMSRLLYIYTNNNHMNNYNEVLIPSFKEFDTEDFAELANLIDELQ